MGGVRFVHLAIYVAITAGLAVVIVVIVAAAMRKQRP